MKKTIHDMLDLYAMKHSSTDMFLMLRDYTLDERLNRDDLNVKIMLELGERQTYWQHTDLLKTNIDNWFTTHEDNIKKLVDTIELEYNPLYNTDYYDDVHEHTVNDDTVHEDLHKVNDDTVHEDLYNHNEGTTSDGYVENQVSAYDSSGYQPQDKSTHHDTTDLETTGDNTIKTDKDETGDNTIKTDKDEDRELDKHHYGKEGTESYQDLIDKERRLAEFNVYDWIIKQLDSEICLGVF